MKTFFKFSTLALIALAAIFYCKESKQKEVQDVLLNNVEALASYEYSEGSCIGIGSVDCPRGYYKVKYVFQ